MAKKRSILNQIAFTLISHLTCVTPFMSMGFSAVSLSTLESSEKLSSTQSSWFASIASLGIPFGCFLSGPIADRFGRRITFICINITCLTGWLIISLSFYLGEYLYPILIIGRFITGVATGLSSMPATVYVAEIASVQMRALLTTVIAVTVAIGICYVYVLGYIFLDRWNLIALTSLVLPSLSIFLTILYLPESPTWLINRNRTEDAKKCMCKIFGTTENTEETQADINVLLQAKMNHEKMSTNKSFSFLLRQPIFYKPFLIILGYFFFQQFSGVYVTVYYANDVVNKSGISIIDNNFAMVLIGITRLLSAVLVTFISKVYGRRPLSIFSGLCMGLCMIGLSVYCYYLSQDKIDPEIYWYIPLSLLLIYFFTASIGFTTLPFAMAPEMFHDSIRGSASGICSCLAYIFSFFIIKIYPNMVDVMNSFGIFLFYGIMSLIGTVFIILFLPETKDKTFKDIQSQYEHKKKHVENVEMEIENLFQIKNKLSK